MEYYVKKFVLTFIPDRFKPNYFQQKSDMLALLICTNISQYDSGALNKPHMPRPGKIFILAWWEND